MKKQGKRSKKKHICQKRLSERLDINKIRGVYLNIRERIKIMKFTKRHYTQQQMKLESLSEILRYALQFSVHERRY